MKHSSTRDLFRYWNDRRGSCPAPERWDIDPTAIPRVLADTFLLGRESGDEFMLRLAGTRVCALFAQELRGAEFAALFAEESRPAVRELVAAVCNEALPAVAGATGRLGDGAAAGLELLLLPLRYQGCTDRRLLGLLAPVSRPYWLGLMPIETLTLEAVRYLGDFPEPPRFAKILPTVPAGRPRHGLRVYDGGLT